MKRERILPGTAHLQRYPWHGAGSPLKGINHYGRSAVNGYAGCYKVGLSQADRIEHIGYLIVKRGAGYCYAYK